MDLQLKDKCVMVAASSKGLGYGIALQLAREGARVSIGSRTEADIEAAAESIRRETGADVLPCVFDASDADSIRDWAAASVNHFGGLDGLVVNAGGPPAGKFDDFDDAAWKDAFDLTLMSSVRMIREALPHMRAAGGGSILTVTSITVKEPVDILLLSNVFRSGVVSLVKSLSHDLAPEGIRVNNLVPGRMDTDRVLSLDTVRAESLGISVAEQRKAAESGIPLGRYGTIEEFGSAAAFLLSDAARYITGTTLTLDGGSSRTVW